MRHPRDAKNHPSAGSHPCVTPCDFSQGQTGMLAVQRARGVVSTKGRGQVSLCLWGDRGGARGTGRGQSKKQTEAQD